MERQLAASQLDPFLFINCRHAFDQKKQASTDLLQRLTTDTDDFATALGIHNSLSELYKLRAAVLAYVANLVLRTIPIVHSELKPDTGDEPVIHEIFATLLAPIAIQNELPEKNRKELSTRAASKGQDRKE